MSGSGNSDPSLEHLSNLKIIMVKLISGRRGRCEKLAASTSRGLMKPLSEQFVKQPAKQQNDFNKLSKLPRRVRRRASTLVQNQNQKDLSFMIVGVVRSHLFTQQAHQRFNRDVDAISSCQPDLSRQNFAILLLDRNTRISRHNSYLVRLYSLNFVVVLVGRSGHTAVPVTPPSGTVSYRYSVVR
jgi:hypothetical protein